MQRDKRPIRHQRLHQNRCKVTKFFRLNKIIRRKSSLPETEIRIIEKGHLLRTKRVYIAKQKGIYYSIKGHIQQGNLCLFIMQSMPFMGNKGYV